MGREPAKEEILSPLPDSLSSRRIEFVLRLRDSVAERGWPGFNRRPVEGPFAYFSGDLSEIYFADTLLLSKVYSYARHGDFYALAPRTDPIPIISN